MGVKHMWTKQEIRKVCELWPTHSVQQIAGEMRLKPVQISAIASQMRKAGFNLPNKTIGSNLSKIFDLVLSEAH